MERVINDKPRLEYIDCLKGFAIFLMVMGHFLSWTFAEGSNASGPAVFVRTLIYSFHMPLFFFLSGYLVDKKNREWTISYCFKLAKKRFVSLVIPGLSFMALLYFRRNFWYFEWFLEVLFEIYIIFMFVQFVRYRYLPKSLFFDIAVQIVAAAVLLVFERNCPSMFAKFFSITRLAHFYPYFAFGFLFCKMGLNDCVLKKNFVITICFFVWAILFFFKYDRTLPFDFVFTFLIASSAIVICMKIAQDQNYNNASFFSKRLLKYGKSSLAIYLLSSMFIPVFPQFGELLIDSSAYKPQVTTVFLQIIAGVFVAFYVSELCLIVKKNVAIE